jgi:hypothetical protein
MTQTFKYTHKSVILSGVLQGCESWSIAFREEHTEGFERHLPEENTWIQDTDSETRMEKKIT